MSIIMVINKRGGRERERRERKGAMFIFLDLGVDWGGRSYMNNKASSDGLAGGIHGLRVDMTSKGACKGSRWPGRGE